MTRNAKLTMSVAVAFIAGLVMLVIIGPPSPSDLRASTPDRVETPTFPTPVYSNPTPPAPPALPSGVTYANYQRLETGMSYPEAMAILGSPGIEQSRSEIAGITTVLYTWRVPRGLANMNAMFQDGKLLTKAQMGLDW